MTSYVFGILGLIASLFGAFIASRAVDAGMATFGIGLVGFGMLLVFWLIKDHFDQQERSRG